MKTVVLTTGTMFLLPSAQSKGMRGFTGTKTQESLEDFQKTYKDFAWIFKG